VAVPDAFYKIVIRIEGNSGTPKVLGFIYPQSAPREKPYSANSHNKYLVSVDKIEEVTRLDFMTILHNSIEASVESRKAQSLWK